MIYKQFKSQSLALREFWLTAKTLTYRTHVRRQSKFSCLSGFLDRLPACQKTFLTRWHSHDRERSWEFEAVNKPRNRQNQTITFRGKILCETFNPKQVFQINQVKISCFARILTYCENFDLPYLCTPTVKVSLSFELSWPSDSVSKTIFWHAEDYCKTKVLR